MMDAPFAPPVPSELNESLIDRGFPMDSPPKLDPAIPPPSRPISKEEIVVDAGELYARWMG